MEKRWGYNSYFEWIFLDHNLELEEYLDEFYREEDHQTIVNFFKTPKFIFKAKIILEDYMRTNSEKIDEILKQFVYEKSKVVLIVGRRGSGKTATALWLAEKLKGKRKVYYSGSPHPDFPKWMRYVADWRRTTPPGSILMIDESAITFSSKRHQEHKELPEHLAVLRHKDVTILFLTQNTSIADLNITRFADAIFWKPVSLVQMATERVAIKKTIITQMFPKQVSQTLYQSAYKTILFEQPLPECWNESISKGFKRVNNKKEAKQYLLFCYNLKLPVRDMIKYISAKGFPMSLDEIKELIGDKVEIKEKSEKEKLMSALT